MKGFSCPWFCFLPIICFFVISFCLSGFINVCCVGLITAETKNRKIQYFFKLTLPVFLLESDEILCWRITGPRFLTVILPSSLTVDIVPWEIMGSLWNIMGLAEEKCELELINEEPILSILTFWLPSSSGISMLRSWSKSIFWITSSYVSVIISWCPQSDWKFSYSIPSNLLTSLSSAKFQHFVLKVDSHWPTEGQLLKNIK